MSESGKPIKIRLYEGYTLLMFIMYLLFLASLGGKLKDILHFNVHFPIKVRYVI